MIYFYMADTLTIFVESVFCWTMITKALKARLVSSFDSSFDSFDSSFDSFDSFDSSNITIIPPVLPVKGVLFLFPPR